jgi:hypothetical protein
VIIGEFLPKPSLPILGGLGVFRGAIFSISTYFFTRFARLFCFFVAVNGFAPNVAESSSRDSAREEKAVSLNFKVGKVLNLADLFNKDLE